MPDKSYPDTDAYGALSNKKEVKVLSWNIWWKFEDYLNRQSLNLVGPVNPNRVLILSLDKEMKLNKLEKIELT